jgi:CrcB protein
MGVCGSFSLMAMAILQGFLLLRDGDYGVFLAYAAGGLCCGVLAALLGSRCGRLLAAHQQRLVVAKAVADANAEDRRRRHVKTAGAHAQAVPGASHALHPQAVESTGPEGAVDHHETVDARQAPASGQSPLAYEPPPITAEIPLVPDPATGEVH